MNKDTEVDMKDVELNELDQEKQPMTGQELVIANEKNGCVKVKVPEDTEFKFTGLSKEELMTVAGTPGWVRTRWALLILFWLGWVGMLAGAIVIIVQAPRCKPLPEMYWWNKGPLYQIWDLDNFVGNVESNLKGLTEKIDRISQLKVKGLVVGPLHTVQKDKEAALDFKAIDPEMGTQSDFESLVDKAHKKGLSVVLDVTPNYNGTNPWFGTSEDLAKAARKLNDAVPHWVNLGVDGFQLGGIDEIIKHNEWVSLRETIQANRTEGTKLRALIGVTQQTSATAVSHLLNSSGVDLLLSQILQPKSSGTQLAQAIQDLYSSQNQTSLAWSIGGRHEGHLGSLVGTKLVTLYQLLLFTLPGTPVFSYGDEIGLGSEQNATAFPKMLWDSEEPVSDQDKNEKSEQRKSFHSFFKVLSDLRGKERSLQHGDFTLLHNSTSSLAFLRWWDQSDRFLSAINWGASQVAMQLTMDFLPKQATVVSSTDPEKNFPSESLVDLGNLELGPHEAVLLRFPFTG